MTKALFQLLSAVPKDKMQPKAMGSPTRQPGIVTPTPKAAQPQIDLNSILPTLQALSQGQNPVEDQSAQAPNGSIGGLLPMFQTLGQQPGQDAAPADATQPQPAVQTATGTADPAEEKLGIWGKGLLKQIQDEDAIQKELTSGLTPKQKAVADARAALMQSVNAPADKVDPYDPQKAVPRKNALIAGGIAALARLLGAHDEAVQGGLGSYIGGLQRQALAKYESQKELAQQSEAARNKKTQGLEYLTKNAETDLSGDEKSLDASRKRQADMAAKYAALQSKDPALKMQAMVQYYQDVEKLPYAEAVKKAGIDYDKKQAQIESTNSLAKERDAKTENFNQMRPYLIAGQIAKNKWTDARTADTEAATDLKKVTREWYPKVQQAKIDNMHEQWKLGRDKLDSLNDRFDKQLDFNKTKLDTQVDIANANRTSKANTVTQKDIDSNQETIDENSAHLEEMKAYKGQIEALQKNDPSNAAYAESLSNINSQIVYRGAAIKRAQERQKQLVDRANASVQVQKPVWNQKKTIDGEALSPQVSKIADSFIGAKYKWGGESPSETDCSGLTCQVYGKMGIKLPRTAAEQFKAGTPISPSDIQPGDLIFYHTNRGIGHVAIYIGDGKQMEASSGKGQVVYSNVRESGFAGVRRFYKKSSGKPTPVHN